MLKRLSETEGVFFLLNGIRVYLPYNIGFGLVPIPKFIIFETGMKNQIAIGILIFFIILLRFSNSVQGVSNNLNLRFQYYTTDDGLAQNTVDCIFRDSKGFMWFGTWNGLCRYDGYNFKTFQKEESFLSLPNNFVRSVCEDSIGNLWIGTAGGLGVYNLHDEKFYLPQELQSVSNDLAVTDVVCDGNGDIWVGAENGKLIRISINNTEGKTIYKVVKVDTEILNGLNINAVCILRNGQILVGTQLGVFEVKAGKLERFHLNGSLAGVFDASIFRCIFESSTGDLWFGSEGGLFWYKKSDKELRLFSTGSVLRSRIEHDIVMAVAEEASGRIIIGTLGGVNFCNPSTGEVSGISGRLDESETLNNRFVNSLFTDNDGNVWIGTEKGGVNKYSIYQKPFFGFRNHVDDLNSLSSNTINSILNDDEILWVGTAGGGLNRINKQSGKVDRIMQESANPNSIAGNFISTLCLSPDKKLWVGTWGNGFGKLLSVNNKSFKNFQSDPNNPNTLVSNFVSKIYPDNRGFLVIGTSGGFDLFNPDKESFFHFQEKFDQTIETPAVGCILKDQKDYYWIGSRTGLFHIPARLVVPVPGKLSASDFQYYTNIPGDSLSIPGNYVISLLEDHMGNVWIGTYGNGICKGVYGADGKVQFKTYTKKDGLCNNVVYSMEEDRNGNIWISTDNGLSKLNPEKVSFQNFYTKDGLLNDQFYWTASGTDSQGNLYFGGINGLNYFNPEKIEYYPRLPKVVFTDFQVFNQPVAIGQKMHGNVILDQPIGETDFLNLSYKDNVFSIEFSALDYFLPDKVSYAYKMEGVDKNWVNVTSARRFATYTNLSGGEYRFLVKASNSDGLWSVEPTVLRININPPFWQTGWFRFVTILALALSILAYIRYRTKYLHEQKRKLEIQVRDRTLQIEEQKEKLQEQAGYLLKSNHELADRQVLIEGQKIELEKQNQLIAEQRDEVLELNKKVSLINQLRLRFFTNISHEFRTPLTLIIDPLESLMRNFEGDNHTFQTLKLINRNAQRLLQLINQLMNFRRIENGKIELRVVTGDLKAFMNSIYESFHDLAENQKISYSFSFDEIKSACWFDAEKLENIFYNLLSNAFKFTPEKGKISFNVSFHESNEDANGMLIPHFKVEVSDSGKGIPVEELPFIFDRFYQAESNTENRQKGSGIGLALTQELVHALHGKIFVQSEYGRGSKFVVLLPYRSEDFASNEIDPAGSVQSVNLQPKIDLITEEILQPNFFDEPDQPLTDKSKPLVLIVEDNYDLRNFLLHSMRNEYRVIGAENGKEGFEMAKKYTPDLIVSDIMMPVMDGLELCSRLKKEIHTSHIPVILLTAKAMIEHWIEGLETGADDYIPKPFNLKVLQLKIINLIESRKKLRQLFGHGETVSPEELTTNQLDQQFIERAYAIVERNIQEPELSVDHFAREMMVSKSLLFKKIKAITGYSIVDFVNMFKLRKAASQLAANPQLNISEIAFAVGFNDPKYFSRIFRKVFGVTPSEYARTLHKSSVIQEN